MYPMNQTGIQFIRPPNNMDYGTVAVFTYLYGNKRGLVRFAAGHPMGARIG